VNINSVQSVPTFPAAFQNVQIGTSIPRIPWRDWVANLETPSEFFDATELNDGLNEKTSQYSGVLGWDVYHQFLIQVRHVKVTRIVNLAFPQGINIETESTTDYALRSDAFDIDDFDVDATATPWVGDVKAFDLFGDLTDNIFKDISVQIEIDFTHTLGILSPQDLWGEIFIEKVNGSDSPYQLHTHRDWTHESSPIVPSDTLLTGNDQFVELISTMNLVQLRCKTNQLNLVESVNYAIVGRLGKQTLY